MLTTNDFFMDNRFVQSLIEKYKTGFSLEQAFYTNNEIFELERKHIFQEDWLYAGNTAQIPKAGDYFLFHLQRDSIIVIRGNKGDVFAHYNTCTHRGSAICVNEKGNAAKFVCPYHQWVFDKNGTLLNARMMPDDFCKEKYNLHSVHVEVVEGLIFISQATEAPDFSNIRKSLASYAKPFKINNANFNFY